MSIQPLSAAGGSRAVSLGSLTSPLDQKFKTIHEVFDWLRGMASSPQERLQLDAEETLFMKRAGADSFVPPDGLTANSLLDWVLEDVSPFDANPPSHDTVETIDAFKTLLAQHLKHKKTTDFDRILYLLRAIDHEKVTMEGKAKPPVEPALRDTQTYHAGYNERTAYLEKHP